MSDETDYAADKIELSREEDNKNSEKIYREDNIENEIRLINILRSIIERKQITAESKEVIIIIQ